MAVELLVLVVGISLVLAYYNGFHDASNAVSTAIATRSLRESTALALAAVLNLLGAMLGVMLLTVTAQWAMALLGLEAMVQGTTPNLLGIALATIAAATIVWEILTWWMGMPSSSWHAFYGGTAGAYIALGMGASLERVAMLVLLPTLLGPLIAAALSFTVMRGILALGRTERVRIRHLRFAQTVSAGAVAAGHGMNDVRLPLALVMVAAASAGMSTTTVLALSAPIAVALAAGTLMGGHRIIRTIGRRMTDLSVAQGLAAEGSSVVVIGALALGIHAPISTSHTLASGVVGAGVALGPRHVHWDVVGRMLLTWIVTPAATGLMTSVTLLLATRL